MSVIATLFDDEPKFARNNTFQWEIYSTYGFFNNFPEKASKS